MRNVGEREKEEVYEGGKAAPRPLTAEESFPGLLPEILPGANFRAVLNIRPEVSPENTQRSLPGAPSARERTGIIRGATIESSAINSERRDPIRL